MKARERDSMQRPRQQFETGLTKGLPVGGDDFSIGQLACAPTSTAHYDGRSTVGLASCGEL